jgi:hypothetical protein
MILLVLADYALGHGLIQNSFLLLLILQIISRARSTAIRPIGRSLSTQDNANIK